MTILRVEEGQDSPFDVELNREELTIGRGTTNHLHFNHPWLSRHHARIVRRREEHYISDVGSRNGTYVNGKILEGEQQLRSGDTIVLGDIRIQFLAGSLSRRVAKTSTPLPVAGTMVLSSDELSVDRYRESARQISRPKRWFSREQEEPSSLLPALNEAASALITHYPLEELVEVVTRLALEAVKAERGALMLRPQAADGDLEIRAVLGYAQGEEVRISRTIIREVLDNKKAILTLDAQEDQRFVQADSILMQGIRSLICVPLWNNREVIGLLYLDQRLAGYRFGENDLRLAALIANMAAVKIENAALLEVEIERKRMAEQLAVGAQIQRGLLPAEDPFIPGYDIGGFNQSCYEIGGDYYDFIRREDGRLAVVIADISGKGVGAALLMAVLQASLRTLIHAVEEPAELVRQLNRVLVENSPPNKFATLFYAELDPRSHTIDYVNGGHNPGLLASRGAVEELDSTGPLVGLVPDAKFSCRRVSLAPGGTLLLFTDGINELTDAQDEEFGTEPLVEMLRDQPGKGSTELIAAIRERMRQWSSAESFEDDTTVVVIRRRE